MTLYGRRISVSVAGLVPEDPAGIPPPRITVAMERQADETQTTGTVAIYNLAPARQQQIFERQGPIQIEAGYPDTVASIFDGQVQRVRHPRQNLARITIIELGDMVRDAGRTGAVSSRSYDGPVTARQLATDFVADMGLTLGPLDAIPAGATRTDFAWAGPSGAGLTVALSPFNVRWFEDDGVIRFRRGMPQPDAPTVTISPDDGIGRIAIVHRRRCGMHDVPKPAGQGRRRAGVDLRCAIGFLPHRRVAPRRRQLERPVYHLG